MIKRAMLGVVVAAAFAAPMDAQIWKRGPDGTIGGGSVETRTDARVETRSGDRVIRRGERVIDGRRCAVVEVQRNGQRRIERYCDWDGDGVLGDADDRRIERDRRDRRADRDGEWQRDRDSDSDSDSDYRNRGQRVSAEARARAWERQARRAEARVEAIDRRQDKLARKQNRRNDRDSD